MEVILAKGFVKIQKFLKEKNLRIIDISDFKFKNLLSVKLFGGSFLMQTKDSIVVDQKLRCVTKLKPQRKELAEIQFAFNICKHVKSNARIM